MNIDLSDNKYNHMKNYVNISNRNTHGAPVTMSLSDIFENNFTCSESPKCYHGGVTFRLVNSEEKPTYK